MQPCLLTSPLANGWVPVYNEPVARAAGAPSPRPDGWLHSTQDRPFVCQQHYPNAEVQSGTSRNAWWAYTKSDDDGRGWVSEVFFSGGLDYEPDGGLRRCPQPTTPGSAQQAPVPATGTPADRDRDGTPDADDACPGEDARARDANLNGCLDYRRLQPDFRLDPDRYVRRVGNGYKALGIKVHRMTVSGLPTGTRVSLSCSRSACPFQRVTTSSRRRVEFKRMRDRKLRTGARITLRATFAGAVGRGATYTVKPNDTRKREFCIRPASGREGSCSTKR